MKSGVIGYGGWKLDVRLVALLTPREREVFLLLATGYAYREMAARLHVSERTVRAHVSAILGKLGLDCAMHARLASYGYVLRRDTGG
ncbi:MAG TPA: helix-turn-helix transcriptional regulator [Nonomuraea sp.]|nr:helix-turn-helix transcriptional regulator [Nonomuraea sp.]